MRDRVILNERNERFASVVSIGELTIKARSGKLGLRMMLEQFSTVCRLVFLMGGIGSASWNPQRSVRSNLCHSLLWRKTLSSEVPQSFFECGFGEAVGKIVGHLSVLVLETP